ncbi:hypothetical protein ABB02_00888 [Clostridiaceae bacterium JG1575]|nr:hypothetical protein ABB02_00888 [Clostridiaceae bacterium JG1575]
MRYYLVAVLNRESNKELDVLQRPLHKKGKNFKKSPYMCIPLDVLEDPDLKTLEKHLRDLLKPFRYFHVDLTGKYINLADERITGLPVANFGYLKKIQRHLNDYLHLYGYCASAERPTDKDFILSMSQDRLPRELENSSDLFQTEDNRRKFLVDRIEVWKTLNAKKESIVFSVPLKNPNII